MSKNKSAEAPVLEQEKTENNQETILNDKIEKLEQDLAEQKNTFLRTLAEYDNFRKRTEREKSSIYADATASAIMGMLPVADSIDRALEANCNAGEEYRKGLEMIKNQLMQSFSQLGVEIFGECGDEFNPDIHNAVAHIDDENLSENSVAAVFQKGYKIGDKIVRHAMVQVAN